VLRELLAGFDSDDFVLDLGSGEGSFNTEGLRCRVVRVDLMPSPGGLSVVADGAMLPFRDNRFRAVVANHSLEHITGVPSVIAEIQRIALPQSFIYISVPDSTSVSDRLYRWLGKGGGHINDFPHADTIPSLIRRWTEFHTIHARTLTCSFHFLSPRGRKGRWQHKLILFGGANYLTIQLLSGLLRTVDCRLGTRWSVYGWEYWCSRDGLPLDLSDCWTNVCTHCGAAHSMSYLQAQETVSRGWLGMPRFRCPSCRASNILTSEVPNRLQLEGGRSSAD
jgi:SAM-dependent methyltransferase